MMNYEEYKNSDSGERRRTTMVATKKILVEIDFEKASYLKYLALTHGTTSRVIRIAINRLIEDLKNDPNALSR